MKSLKVLAIFLLIFCVSACACKTKPNSINPANIPVAEAGSILKDIHFAFDQAELSPVAKSILSQNAEWLTDNKGANITIEGHCDERGTREYNLALGQRRAQSAYSYLRSLGVDGGRMETVSFGEDQPLDPRNTEEAWSQNRRVHFRIE